MQLGTELIRPRYFVPRINSINRFHKPRIGILGKTVTFDVTSLSLLLFRIRACLAFFLLYGTKREDCKTKLYLHEISDQMCFDVKLYRKIKTFKKTTN